MSKKTFFLLGAAHLHLPDPLRHIDRRGWRVSYVHDQNPDRRETLCADLDARVLPDLDGIPDTPCTAALVCRETVHHEAALRCATLAKERGLLLHTRFFFRTNGALQRLGSDLDARLIGRVIAARMRFSDGGGYADWLELNCRMTDPALACYDGFVEEAEHVIDTLWLSRRNTHAPPNPIRLSLPDASKTGIPCGTRHRSRHIAIPAKGKPRWIMH